MGFSSERQSLDISFSKGRATAARGWGCGGPGLPRQLEGSGLAPRPPGLCSLSYPSCLAPSPCPLPLAPSPLSPAGLEPSQGVATCPAPGRPSAGAVSEDGSWHLEHRVATPREAPVCPWAPGMGPGRRGVWEGDGRRLWLRPLPSRPPTEPASSRPALWPPCLPLNPQQNPSWNGASGSRVGSRTPDWQAPVSPNPVLGSGQTASQGRRCR